MTTTMVHNNTTSAVNTFTDHNINSITTIYNIKNDYQSVIIDVMDKLGELCLPKPNENDGHPPFESSLSIQCRILSVLTLEVPCQKAYNVIKLYMRQKSNPEMEEIEHAFMQWMKLHNNFSAVMLEYIQNVVQSSKKYNISKGATTTLMKYVKSLCISDVIDFISYIIDENTCPLLFIPKYCDEVDMYGNAQETSSKIESLSFQTFNDWIRHTLRNMDVFDIPPYVENNLLDYFREFPRYMQLDMIKYFHSDDFINSTYLVPDLPNASVIMFRYFGNHVVDLQFVERDEWEFIISTDETNDPNYNGLVDVVVTLTKDQYNSHIERKRLTKKMVKENNIPETCCICMDEFKVGNQIHKTNCGHYYHARCLKTLLCKMGPPKCPLCRNDVRK